MTQVVEFYGASDDLIEVEGNIPGCDEYPGESGEFEVAGLRVNVDYDTNGCWGIRIVQIDERVPVTATDISVITPPNGTGITAEALSGEAHPPYPTYSVRLRMNVPDGSYVTKVNVR